MTADHATPERVLATAERIVHSREPQGDQAQLALKPADAGPATDWRDGTWACLDLEMTGLGPDGRIVEIAIVTMRGGAVVEAWSSLVNPGIEIPTEATAIHGITNEMVAAAPTINRLRPEVLSRLTKSDAIVAYNGYGADFDWLERELPGVIPMRPIKVDPLVLVRKVLRYMKGDAEKRVKCPIWSFDEDGYAERSPKTAGRHSQGRVAEYLGVLKDKPDAFSKLHSAEFDAEVTGLVTWELRRECNSNGPRFERWARAEYTRQVNSQRAYFDGLRAADAARRVARETFEQRIGARFTALEQKLEVLAVAQWTGSGATQCAHCKQFVEASHTYCPYCGAQGRIEVVAEPPRNQLLLAGTQSLSEVARHLPAVASRLDAIPDDAPLLKVRLAELEAYCAKLELEAKLASFTGETL